MPFFIPVCFSANKGFKGLDSGKNVCSRCLGYPSDLQRHVGITLKDYQQYDVEFITWLHSICVVLIVLSKITQHLFFVIRLAENVFFLTVVSPSVSNAEHSTVGKLM